MNEFINIGSLNVAVPADLDVFHHSGSQPSTPESKPINHVADQFPHIINECINERGDVGWWYFAETFTDGV